MGASMCVRIERARALRSGKATRLPGAAPSSSTLHEHDGDVVDAALLVGEVDELLAQVLGALVLVGRDRCRGSPRRRASSSARPSRRGTRRPTGTPAPQVRRNRGAAAERARHDVLQRMRLRLLLGQDPGRDLLVDPGVVVGQARELARRGRDTRGCRRRARGRGSSRSAGRRRPSSPCPSATAGPRRPPSRARWPSRSRPRGGCC